MLPQHLLFLPSEIFEHFEASLSIAFLDFLNEHNVKALDFFEFRSPPVFLQRIFTKSDSLIILCLSIIDIRRLQRPLQLLSGRGLLLPLFTTILLGLSAVLD
jgi:hypothetical protein